MRYTDFRLQCGFLGNLKVQELAERLGAPGVLAWLQLIDYAASWKPDGCLGRMTPRAISVCAGLHLIPGAPDPTELFAVLSSSEVGLIDIDGDGMAWLHDWADHQSGICANEVKRESGKRGGRPKKTTTKTIEKTIPKTIGESIRKPPTDPTDPTYPTDPTDRTTQETKNRALRCVDEGLPAPSTPDEIRKRRERSEGIQKRWNSMAESLGPPLIPSSTIFDREAVEAALWRFEDVRDGIDLALDKIEAHGVAKWRTRALKLTDVVDPSKIGNCLNGSWTGEYREPETKPARQGIKADLEEFMESFDRVQERLAGNGD